MMSKDKQNPHSGTFCQMVTTYNKQGTLQFGPDFVRLRYRYEVTNGVSEATDLNMIARAQSYLTMIGA